MNNLIINSFQSIVYSPLFWITTCYLSARKVQLVSGGRIFSQMFSPYLLKKISYSAHFVEKEKDESHLVQGLLNMVDGVEQTRQFQIFSLWFLLNVALRYHREAQHLSYWRVF